VLELRELSFAIEKEGEEVNLIDRASLSIPRGHFMAIVGPSGCGKTTLLKTVAGLNPESGGSILWQGRDGRGGGGGNPPACALTGGE